MNKPTIEQGQNDVYLLGTVFEAPQFVYEQHGNRILEGLLGVPRRSGVIDRLPFIGEEDVLGEIGAGDYISLSGAMIHRDKNTHPNSRYRLVVSAWSAGIAPSDWPYQNIVKLSGHLCRAPFFRVTPRGREVCEVTLAVPRGTGRQDYILCIAWNETARTISGYVNGAPLTVTGRFQSREYNKRLKDGSVVARLAHEVSIDSIA